MASHEVDRNLADRAVSGVGACVLAALVLACGVEAGPGRGTGGGSADGGGAGAPRPPTVDPLDSVALAGAQARASDLRRIRSLLVAQRGTTVAEWYFNGASSQEVANLKSASKGVISALVGIALAEGTLDSLDQPIAPFFESELPADPDPRMDRVTIRHLLGMRAGLESTSFGNYGRWVSSRNWVRHALSRPFVAEPGGRMIYSTGNTHLLSAILTRAAGTSTWAYARSRLAEPLGIELPRWTRDPQGIYFGGNNMQLRPRAMLRLGELYRNGGRWQGRQVVPESWIHESWTPRVRSRYNGYGFGYGWWHRVIRGQDVRFAWGYGGQFIFVVPSLDLTVAITSDPRPGARRGHRSALFSILSDCLMAPTLGVTAGCATRRRAAGWPLSWTKPDGP